MTILLPLDLLWRVAYILLVVAGLSVIGSLLLASFIYGSTRNLVLLLCTLLVLACLFHFLEYPLVSIVFSGLILFWFSMLLILFVMMAWWNPLQKKVRVTTLVGDPKNPRCLENLKRLAENPELPKVLPEHVEKLNAIIDMSSPEKLISAEIAETILRKIDINASPAILSLNGEVFANLFVRIKKKTGETFQQRSFDLAQKDRVLSRVAEIGLKAWQAEVEDEHQAFPAISRSLSYCREQLFEDLTRTKARGMRSVSKTLGSLPLHLCLTYNSDPFEMDEMARTKATEALVILAYFDIDFSKEELTDPSLQEFLHNVQSERVDSRGTE